MKILRSGYTARRAARASGRAFAASAQFFGSPCFICCVRAPDGNFILLLDLCFVMRATQKITMAAIISDKSYD